MTESFPLGAPPHKIGSEAAADVAAGIGTKDDKGKTDLTLIDPYYVELTCKVLEIGMRKYERGNWQRNLDPKRIMAALKRHISLYEKGEILDKESGLSHTGHISCNAMFLYYYERHGNPLKTEHDKG